MNVFNVGGGSSFRIKVKPGLYVFPPSAYVLVFGGLLWILELLYDSSGENPMKTYWDKMKEGEGIDSEDDEISTTEKKTYRWIAWNRFTSRGARFSPHTTMNSPTKFDMYMAYAIVRDSSLSLEEQLTMWFNQPYLDITELLIQMNVWIPSDKRPHAVHFNIGNCTDPQHHTWWGTKHCTYKNGYKKPIYKGLSVKLHVFSALVMKTYFPHVIWINSSPNDKMYGIFKKKVETNLLHEEYVHDVLKEFNLAIGIRICVKVASLSSLDLFNDS
jgi:hypothetical protein